MSIYKEPTRFKSEGPSRTKQSFKDECDINKIVKRFTKSNGIDPSMLQGFPVDGNFGDFSDVPDLRTMYERIAVAEESFYQLPSKVRMRFDNDALAFMEFASDASNLQEMRELGLVRTNLEEPTPATDPEV